MLQAEDKVFVPFDAESDRAGEVGVVEKIYDPQGVQPEDPAFLAGYEEGDAIVTVVFGDGKDEVFREGDLRKFSKFSFTVGYVRANWKNFMKEAGAIVLIVGIVSIVALISGAFDDKKPEPPKPVDPIVKLGQLKAEIEVKRSEALARQRDLKRELETSYATVSGYDTQIQGYDARIMEIVNPKDSKLEVKVTK